MSTVDETASAIRAGKCAVIPTDTVYGLVCRPVCDDAVRLLSTLKRRSAEQPIALVASDVDVLIELIPELAEQTLVAGPFTLILPNPERRMPSLSGSQSDTIGVRIPELEGAAAELLARVGVVAATSANLHGGADPRCITDLPSEILTCVAAVLDGGELPGIPSTVLDLTGPEPVVVREGAVPAAEALARVAEALRQ